MFKLIPHFIFLTLLTSTCFSQHLNFLFVPFSCDFVVLFRSLCERSYFLSCGYVLDYQIIFDSMFLASSILQIMRHEHFKHFNLIVFINICWKINQIIRILFKKKTFSKSVQFKRIATKINSKT